MKTLRACITRLGDLFRRSPRDEEFRAELEAHILMHVDDGIRAGLSAAEARRQAVLKLGGIDVTTESYRDRLGLPWIETLVRELRYAWRLLRKNPAFTVVAVLSLALGIGANTAIFSLVEGVLLRPLPWNEPDRLMAVVRSGSISNVSVEEYRLANESRGSFASIAGSRGAEDRRLVSGMHDDWVKAMPVTTDFFRTLGAPLALGREFTRDETLPTGPQAVILTDGVWRSVFGGDPNAIGRTVRLDGVSLTVVGVANAGLWLPDAADLFVPLRPVDSASDRGANTALIGRLKHGVDPSQAQPELARVGAEYKRADPDRVMKDYRGLTAIPFREQLVGDVRAKLLLLQGSTGLLLLIACLNLASLLLARLAARRQEIALRLALGSSRGALLRQFLIENLLVCGAGGVAGFIGAHWMVKGFLAVVPYRLPLPASVGLDLPVLLFTTAVIAATVLLISAAPARMSPRLSGAGRSAGMADRHLPARNLMVVAEVAGAATLLAGAALLMHSLYRMSEQPLGFEPRNVLTFWTPPRAPATLLAQLQSVPGVRGIAAVNVLPLAGFSNFPTQREDHPEQSIGGMEIRVVSPAYFETLGISLRRGRSFTDADASRTRPVAVINETLARAWWPAANPLGDRVVVGRFHGQNVGQNLMEDATREIVGVAADTKTVRMTQPAPPTIFVPMAQAAWYTGGMSWMVRGDSSSGLREGLQRRMKEVDPALRAEHWQTMEQIVGATTAGSRFDAWLFGAFAGLALMLTAIGVYGLLSFSVARRSSEIGTRMALGATPFAVLSLILRQGLALVVVGLALGLGGAMLLARSLAGSLFGVRPADPLSFALVAAVLLGVGLLASYLPARRATRVDPLVALRCE